MTPVSIERHPNGPRVRTFGQRVHHGAVGCALLLTPDRRARAIGLALAAHDSHDWRQWFAPGAQRT